MTPLMGNVSAEKCVDKLPITGIVNTLEGQQGALHGMLNNLERMLYGGNAPEISSENAKQVEGFEIRLNDVTSSFERALGKLDYIISRL